MDALLIYLIKSGALIALFWAGYHFFLRHDTFFKSNRWYLLIGLVTSVILPLVTFKKVVVVDPAPQALNWTTVAQTVQAPPPQEIDWLLIGAIAYLVGMAVLLTKFASDLYSLRRALRGKPVKLQDDFKFVDTKENIAPFSYFNYIVYNSSLYSEQELRSIIAHEKVHSDQYHSADVLAARVFTILFWFNPFMWLYKKSILQNLEYLADSEAARVIEDKRAYQITLLKVIAHENCIEISNQFFQSLIKKRIVMLNKNQSNRRNAIKYALVIPALAAFMLYFQVRVVAQVKEVVDVVKVAALQEDVRVVVDKNTTDAQLKAESERLRKEHGIKLKFSKVKRNTQGEITAIKAEFKDKSGNKGISHISGEEPIKPISFYKSDDGKAGFASHGSTRMALGPKRIEIMRSAHPDFPDMPAPPAVPGDNLDAPHPPKAPHPRVFVREIKDGNRVVIVDGEVVEGDDENIIIDIDHPEDGFAYAYKDKDRVILEKKEIRKIAKEAMEKAKVEMEKVRPELERARVEMEKNRTRLTPGEFYQGNKEQMEAARVEMERAREEIKKAQIELEKARQELEKARARK